MDSIIRAAVTYLFVWLALRISGKRSFSEMTTFDFVLLLIISETTQAALLDNDNSMTNSFLLVSTFVGLELILTKVKQRFSRAERIMDGAPVVVIEDGDIHHDRLREERIDEADIMFYARETQGLERLDQIKFAVLEKSGGISVIPKEPESSS
ncbi:hypothetical protein D3C72_671060 [compost metagenome]